MRGRSIGRLKLLTKRSQPLRWSSRTDPPNLLAFFGLAGSQTDDSEWAICVPADRRLLAQPPVICMSGFTVLGLARVTRPDRFARCGRTPPVGVAVAGCFRPGGNLPQHPRACAWPEPAGHSQRLSPRRAMLLACTRSVLLANRRGVAAPLGCRGNRPASPSVSAEPPGPGGEAGADRRHSLRGRGRLPDGSGSRRSVPVTSRWPPSLATARLRHLLEPEQVPHGRG